jgi:uncharacterized protein YkwD
LGGKALFEKLEVATDDIPPSVPHPPAGHHAPTLRKKKAKKRLILIAIGVAVIGVGYWYFESSFSLPFQKIASFEASVSSEVQNNFSAPAPLKEIPKTAAKKANTLTVEGVIADTNTQRTDNALAPLAENDTLDDIATLRLDDMFAKQYFAHIAPNGASALTVASSVGYSYLALGENLALGNFAGDSGVVTAWMNSPGHRANILDVHYTQIGVAVREGVFQGESTWIAVQVFGKPASACPAPDADLKTAIDTSESDIATMEGDLQTEKAAINAMQPQSGDAYNQKVSEYNSLVSQYNNLTAQAQAAITQYNTEINSFNACLAS